MILRKNLKMSIMKYLVLFVQPRKNRVQDDFQFLI